jgi:ADP-heptose:LPS heptosyltransferase
METKPEKIAVFRALYLGDMLCIIPAIRSLKKAFPESSLTLIGLPWQKDFANRFNYYFDRFIEFPGWPGLPEQRADPKRVTEFLSAMQNENFDIVLQMQGHGAITNSMCMLWAAKKVVGLRKPDDYCPDEKLFPVSSDDEHEVLRYLKLTNALDIPQQGTHLEFPLHREDVEYFHLMNQKLKLSLGDYVCLHPGARDPRRRWPVENFALVGNYLAGKGNKIVLTGSEAERDLLAELTSQIQHPVINTIELFPEMSLGGLASIIKYCKLLLSNDTGVSHIAAALQVPSVVIFSPFSDERRWAPLHASLHKVISFQESKNPDYVIASALNQLEKHLVQESSNLFH